MGKCCCSVTLPVAHPGHLHVLLILRRRCVYSHPVSINPLSKNSSLWNSSFIQWGYTLVGDTLAGIHFICNWLLPLKHCELCTLFCVDNNPLKPWSTWSLFPDLDTEAQSCFVYFASSLFRLCGSSQGIGLNMFHAPGERCSLDSRRMM